MNWEGGETQRAFASQAGANCRAEMFPRRGLTPTEQYFKVEV
jgi:hypothetical protein